MTFNEYAGKRVVVTGCSSGIGLATATALVELGAEVIGMSRRRPDLDLARFVHLDLLEPASIETATRDTRGAIDALFNCAGAPPFVASLDLVKINFLGTRLLTERLIESMPAGAAIVNISSSSASSWRKKIPLLESFLQTESFESGRAWYLGNEEKAGHGYLFSKEAVSLWTLHQSVALVKSGIRMNATSPGAVDTPLLHAAEQVFPSELLEANEEPSGRRSTVNEQVSALLFLNSTLGSYVTGADVPVDGGYTAQQAISGGLW